MSIEAAELQEILPGIFRWECYSPEHKVHLTSHAVLAAGTLYVFDPIPLVETARRKLLEVTKKVAIVLTNENHLRATQEWRKTAGAAVWAAGPMGLDGAIQTWTSPRWGPWEIFDLPGGELGEKTFRWRERSLVVFGDAIFNLPDYGFRILPEKYCPDQDKLWERLRLLTDDPFEVALFAHGAPLLTGASRAIAGLVC